MGLCNPGSRVQATSTVADTTWTNKLSAPSLSSSFCCQQENLSIAVSDARQPAPHLTLPVRREPLKGLNVGQRLMIVVWRRGLQSVTLSAEPVWLRQDARLSTLTWPVLKWTG